MKAVWIAADFPELIDTISAQIDKGLERVQELKGILDTQRERYKAAPWYKRWLLDDPDGGWVGGPDYRRWMWAVDDVQQLGFLRDRVAFALEGLAAEVVLSDREIRSLF